MICYAEGNMLRYVTSQKKQDADALILDFFSTHSVELIGIDAPLSLPAVYHDKTQNDYFYREADKTLGAMSPMFLGGLTARAMRLCHQLTTPSCHVIEVYPAALARHLQLTAIGYKNELEHITPVANVIQPYLPGFNISIDFLHSWHHVDALLCFLTTQRYLNKQAITAGNANEGTIIY